MKFWYIRIAAYARSEARPMVVVLMLVVGLSALEALKPWPMKLMLDHALAGKPFPPRAAWILSLPGAAGQTGRIAYLAFASVILFLVVAVLRSVQVYIQSAASTRMIYRLSADLFEHVQRLSLKFHTRNKTGDLLQRIMNDSSCVRELIINVAMPLLTSVTSLLAMFLIMWRMDAVLTGMAIVFAPALLLAIRLCAKPMEDRGYEQSEEQGRMMGMAEQTLSAIPIVQAFTREPHEDRRFKELTDRTNRAYFRSQVAQLWFQIATTSVTAAGTAVILLLGGWHTLHGRLSIGTLLVFVSYLAAFYSPMESIAYLASGWAAASAGARRVLQIMQIREEITDGPGAIELAIPRQAGLSQIVLRDVSFGYEPGQTVLRKISVVVESGQRVALVGATGSGKTTMLSLLLRLFDPSSGSITIGGRDLREIGLASLRAHIAIVLQDPHLFPVSIAENISYGRPDATRQEIEAAATAAQAHEFISRLPEGYDTSIGERGATLSGGERQRISIARAILKDAPLLIMDEPTAAMDVRTEAELMAALDQLTRGRTSIIAAHRLSTIRNADRIFVLDNGELVESGSEAELLAQEGLYYRFHRLQSSTTTTTP